MSRKLAESVRNIIARDTNLFDFRQNDIAPVLLIIDRREDSITPLLNQVSFLLILIITLLILNILIKLVDLSSDGK